MKRIFSILLGLGLATLLSAPLSAQKSYYQPSTTWPYFFEEFQEGAILTADKKFLNNPDDVFNINIADGKIHYMSDKTIMEADMRRISIARIGKTVFLNIGGKMHEVLYEGKGLVVVLTEPDVDQMAKADIGYGISSATASHQKTSLDMMQIVSGTFLDDVNQVANGGRPTFDRDSGETIPTRKLLYLVVDGLRIDATKRAVMDYPGVDADAAKAFFKKNKIKWNKVESLAEVADFVYDQLHSQR